MMLREHLEHCEHLLEEEQAREPGSRGVPSSS